MYNLIKKENSQNSAPVHSLQRQIDSLFNNFLQDFDYGLPTNSGLIKTFQPRVNIAEDEKAYYLEAELPGIKKEDVKLEYHDDKTLTISAEKKEEKREETKKYHRVESSYGSFFRSFALPDNIDTSAIKAEMKEGILNVALPKANKKESGSNEIKIS